MGARSKLRSISVRMEDDLWRKIESAIRSVEVATGITPSTNAIIVSAVRDGLALRGLMSWAASLPGWEFHTSVRVWDRKIGAYTMQVEPSDGCDGWAWIIYATDPASDEVLFEWKGSSPSAVECMVMAENYMLGHKQGDA